MRRLARAAGLALIAAQLTVSTTTLVTGTARAQGALSAIESDVDRIARRARPSLVTVIAQRTVRRLVPGRGTYTTRVHNRVGSGVAVEENGILTTASVVFGAERVLVLTDNGLQAEARVAGSDPIFNVALLRVPELRLPTIPLAERAPQVGDWVIALGSSYRASPTQSVGNIAYRFREPRMSLLQLTNEVYPGNSGGAAINSRGELIGIVQGELGVPQSTGRTEYSEPRPGGTSFVLPVDDVRPVYASLGREGRVRHGYLGVTTRAAVVESETERGLTIPLGALVESVQPQSPAEKLGLRKGDLIVAFDGERVEYPEQLARWVAASRPGSTVNLVWARDEYQKSGRVLLVESPSTIPSWIKTEVAEASPPAPRMSDLESEVRRLNREIARLRSGADSAR